MSTVQSTATAVMAMAAAAVGVLTAYALVDTEQLVASDLTDVDDSDGNAWLSQARDSVAKEATLVGLQTAKADPSMIGFAPPGESAQMASDTTPVAQAIKGVPEPDATLIPGHNFPEVQARAVDMISDNAAMVSDTATTTTNATSDRSIARFPSRAASACSGAYCVNFGGADGFPYESATDAERAAFRAVIAQYATKGDTVTIKYLDNTESELPKVRGQRRVACKAWSDIYSSVEVAKCTSNNNYIQTWLHDHNRAHHTALTDLLERSYVLSGRTSPREEVEVPLLDPNFAQQLSTAGSGKGQQKQAIAVTGPTTVPYMQALASALDPARLHRLDAVIKAVTRQCEVQSFRNLDIDELDEPGLQVLRNYPTSETDSSDAYYMQQGDDYGVVEKVFEATAKKELVAPTWQEEPVKVSTQGGGGGVFDS